MKKQFRNSAVTAALFLSVSLTACAGTNKAAQTVAETTQAETSNAEENAKDVNTIDSSAAEDSSSDQNAASASKGAILSSDELPFKLGQKIDSPSFTGAAYIESMIQKDDTYHFPSTNHITFEPGARSSWHSHGGMIILATGGIGYYQEEGKPAQILRKGDVVNIEPGVRHWHGAAPDSWFSQIVIYDSEYQPDANAPEEVPVSDEEYQSLESEEYTGRTTTPDNPFMFERAPEAMTADTFSGPTYVSSLIGADNAAGAPDLHYVVFDPGVINNWHTHEGGQILIATDGIGYHQIEGEPVQVLYPGDVAFCPPSVKHWHGGSADTSFAHIAANTNPELTGLEWFDRISDEEYQALPTERDAICEK